MQMHEWNKTNWFQNWLVWACAIDLHTAWSLLRKLHRFCTTFFIFMMHEWANAMISQSQKMNFDNTESKIYSSVVLRFHSFNANHSSWWSDHSHQSTSSAVFLYVEKLENHLVTSRRCALTLFGQIYYSRFFPCRSERINKLAVFN